MRKNSKGKQHLRDQPRLDNFFGIAKDPSGKLSPNRNDALSPAISDPSKQNAQDNMRLSPRLDVLKDRDTMDDREIQGILRNMGSGYESSKTVEIDDNEDVEIISSKQKPPAASNNKHDDRMHEESPTIYTNHNNATMYKEKKLNLALPNSIPRIWKEIEPKLQNIKQAKLQTIDDLLEVISDFIQLHFERKINKINLKVFISLLETFNAKEVDYFFDVLLPFMANLALRIEYLFKNEPIKILSQNAENYTAVTLTKEQVACLLSHMFFCTMHPQNNHVLPHDCNFSLLYRDSRRNDLRLEKLKCFYNYFKRVQGSTTLSTTNITYQRLVHDVLTHGNTDERFWEGSKEGLSKVIILDDGAIEGRKGAIQVDFANKFLGGGVLDSGCVQEEIRFAISPELVASMLFTERLLDHEAMIMMGAEQYSEYTGYSDTFKYAGDFKDKTEFDLFNRKDVTILAIDAIDFSRTSSKQSQYQMAQILRELNKAYIGFYGSDQETGDRKEIATGRWGCGNFLGDAQLKFILQWMAASKTRRTLVFYRFNDASTKDLERVIKRIKDFKICELYEQLKLYSRMLFVDKVEMPLFDYLLDVA